MREEGGMFVVHIKNHLDLLFTQEKMFLIRSMTLNYFTTLISSYHYGPN